MKRKVMGLTMNVTKDKLFTKYEFINPCSLTVVNGIMCELTENKEKYNYSIVRNFTDEITINGNDYFTGYIICRDREQAIRYFNIPNIEL